MNIKKPGIIITFLVKLLCLGMVFYIASFKENLVLADVADIVFYGVMYLAIKIDESEEEND